MYTHYKTFESKSSANSQRKCMKYLFTIREIFLNTPLSNIYHRHKIQSQNKLTFHNKNIYD